MNCCYINKESKKGLPRLAGLVLQNYIGDVVISSDNQVAAVAKVGTVYYIICPPREGKAKTDRSDIGLVYAYDEVTNRIVTDYPKSIELGHGNSIAYDDNEDIFYVAPAFTYISGAAVETEYILKINKGFSVAEHIPTPVRFLGVSYDHVAKKLYGYDIHGDIYIQEDKEWKLAATIPGFAKWQLDNYYLEQDIAIQDGIYTIVGSTGAMIRGKISTGEILEWNVTDIKDLSGLYYLGETEGIEYGTDGKLYGMRMSTLQAYSATVSGEYLGVVTQYMENDIAARPWSFASNQYYTFELNDDTVSEFHHSNPAYIKHPAQINFMDNVSPHAALNWSAQKRFGDVTLVVNDIQIVPNNLKCKSLTINGGQVSICATTGACLIDITNDKISLQRNANLKIQGYPIDLVRTTDIDYNDTVYTPYISLKSQAHSTSKFTNKGTTMEAGFYMGTNRIG